MTSTLTQRSKQAIVITLIIVILQFAMMVEVSSAQSGLILLFNDYSVYGLSWTADSTKIRFRSASTNGVNGFYNISSGTMSTALYLPTEQLTSEEIEAFQVYNSLYEESYFVSPDSKFAVFLSRDPVDPESDMPSVRQVFLADRTNQGVIALGSMMPPPLIVQWAVDSSSFVIFSGPFEGSDADITPRAVIVNFASDVEKAQGIGFPEFSINGTSYRIGAKLHQVLEEGKLLLVEANEIQFSEEYIEPQPALILYSVMTPQASQVLLPNATKLIAAHITRDDRLLAVNEHGLVEIDLSDHKTRVIDAAINSEWAYEAAFSPDDRWLALFHAAPQGIDVYLADLDILAR
ncbi:MAG: hypothetical protein KF726_21320 [Anaerolineae bacterium]|nr:hypothetical protein [Anaerolineae bacterium]